MNYIQAEQVQVLCAAEADRVRITFRDGGLPFDPLSANSSAAPAPRTAGGMEIRITRTIMDQVEYKYQDGRNDLTITSNRTAMKVTKTVSGSRMGLAVERKIDAVSAPMLEAEIAGQLEGITEPDIDFGAVEYISSAVLHTLLYFQQTLDEVNGTLTVRNVPRIAMRKRI